MRIIYKTGHHVSHINPVLEWLFILQPGYLSSLRSVAFRPCLTTGLAKIISILFIHLILVCVNFMVEFKSGPASTLISLFFYGCGILKSNLIVFCHQERFFVLMVS